MACSDSETELKLYSAARANTGMSSISRGTAGRAGTIRNVYHVRARPLDAILQEASASRVDVIKIDVEGAELLVLRGSRQTLSEHSPILIVEMIERQLRAMGTSKAEVTEFLGSFGYTLREDLGFNWMFSKSCTRSK